MILWSLLFKKTKNWLHYNTKVNHSPWHGLIKTTQKEHNGYIKIHIYKWELEWKDYKYILIYSSLPRLIEMKTQPNKMENERKRRRKTIICLMRTYEFLYRKKEEKRILKLWTSNVNVETDRTGGRRKWMTVFDVGYRVLCFCVEGKRVGSLKYKWRGGRCRGRGRGHACTQDMKFPLWIKRLQCHQKRQKRGRESI